MAMLGVPYGDAVNKAAEMARAQAKVIGSDLAQTGGGAGFETKEVTALIAYMQRLGRDISSGQGAVAAKPPVSPASAPAVTGGGQP
jgi:cytochrome c oxidase cbb3-type subunit I/II